MKKFYVVAWKQHLAGMGDFEHHATKAYKNRKSANKFACNLIMNDIAIGEVEIATYDENANQIETEFYN